MRKNLFLCYLIPRDHPFSMYAEILENSTPPPPHVRKRTNLYTPLPPMYANVRILYTPSPLDCVHTKWMVPT